MLTLIQRHVGSIPTCPARKKVFFVVWRLVGTEVQNAIIQAALNRCDFPFERLAPKLVADVGRDYIPVEWADLSQYAASASESKHIEIDGGTAHVLEYRQQTLGLAWYSGKISIEKSLESDPELAGEVFIAEGAHMVDFFYMTDAHREAIFNAYHGGSATEHGHGWFDVADYRAWVGESFMGGFAQAYTDFPVTIPFTHDSPEAVGPVIRKILTPDLVEDETPVEPTPEPTPEPDVPVDEPVVEDDVMPTPYFVGKNRSIFHDSHKGIQVVEYFTTTPADARPCGVCKPGV